MVCCNNGILCIFFVFINVFTSVADNSSTPYATHNVSLDNMQQFEETLATAVNSTVEKASPVTILTNGQEFLPDLLTEINNAKRSIYITDYIWDGGDFGTTLLKALVEKAKGGVVPESPPSQMSVSYINRPLCVINFC